MYKSLQLSSVHIMCNGDIMKWVVHNWHTYVHMYKGAGKKNSILNGSADRPPPPPLADAFGMQCFLTCSLNIVNDWTKALITKSFNCVMRAVNKVKYLEHKCFLSAERGKLELCCPATVKGLLQGSDVPIPWQNFIHPYKIPHIKY